MSYWTPGDRAILHTTGHPDVPSNAVIVVRVDGRSVLVRYSSAQGPGSYISCDESELIPPVSLEEWLSL